MTLSTLNNCQFTFVIQKEGKNDSRRQEYNPLENYREIHFDRWWNKKVLYNDNIYKILIL